MYRQDMIKAIILEKASRENINIGNKISLLHELFAKSYSEILVIYEKLKQGVIE